MYSYAINKGKNVKKWMMLATLALLLPSLVCADRPPTTQCCPLLDLGAGEWNSWEGWQEVESLILPYGLHARWMTLAGDAYVLRFAIVACPTSEMPCEDGQDDIAILARKFERPFHVESWAVCPTVSEIGIVWASLTALNDPDGASWEVFDAFDNWQAGVLYQSQLQAITTGRLPDPFYIFPQRLYITVNMTGGAIDKIALGKRESGSIVIGLVNEEWILVENNDDPWIGAFSKSVLCYMNCGSAGCFSEFAYDSALDGFWRFMDSIHFATTRKRQRAI